MRSTVGIWTKKGVNLQVSTVMAPAHVCMCAIVCVQYSGHMDDRKSVQSTGTARCV